jgi:tetratricopeptide (TPR) repeat protein
MKSSTAVLVCLLATNWFTSPSLAKTANSTPFKKNANFAQQEFDRGNYHKAKTLWEQSLSLVQQSHATDEDLANALKRLGETLLKLGKYAEAEICFVHAKDLYKELNFPDAELVGDFAMLSQAYKSIDIETLGQFAEELQREARICTVGFTKTETGDRVQIELLKPFEKSVNNQYVHAIELGSRVRLDITQEPDGTIRVHDIHGLNIKSSHWVKVTELTFARGDGELHVASISAKHLGVTRTVTAKLSGRMYSLISAIANQIKSRPQVTPSLAESGRKDHDGSSEVNAASSQPNAVTPTQAGTNAAEINAAASSPKIESSVDTSVLDFLNQGLDDNARPLKQPASGGNVP